MSTLETASCPICGELWPIEHLPDHCTAHFADSETHYSGTDGVIDLCDDEGRPLALPSGTTDAERESGQKRPLEPQRGTEKQSAAPASAMPSQSRARTAGHGIPPQDDKSRCFKCKAVGHWVRDCPQTQPSKKTQPVIEATPDAILAAQHPAEAQPDVYSELLNRLHAQQPATTRHILLSGPVALYSGDASDRGWGCGWRNIQMQLSHLLQTRPDGCQKNMALDRRKAPAGTAICLSGKGKQIEKKRDVQDARRAICGGAGIVPDIPSLQAWLECCWQAGFDAVGASQLGHAVQASKKWIGTTECAALLRYWGLRAQIIDFCLGNAPGQASDSSEAGSSTKDAVEIHHGVQCDGCGECPIVGPRMKSQAVDNYDLCSTCHGRNHSQTLGSFLRVLPGNSGGAGNSLGQSSHQLAAWVWQYFSGKAEGSLTGRHPASRAPGVELTGKAPLFFQHAGHSRTIIGIERDSSRPGHQGEYQLLIFDPSTPAAALHETLRTGGTWQRLVKRGVHTLKKAEYQLLYVEPGIAARVERDSLKLIRRKALIT